MKSSVYKLLTPRAVLYQLVFSACHPSSLLLFHLTLSFCSFKERASQEAVEGGSKQRTNRHSQIFNEFLQLALNLAKLSGDTQITEGPPKSQVLRARRMGAALNVSACAPEAQGGAVGSRWFGGIFPAFAGPKNKYGD